MVVETGRGLKGEERPTSRSPALPLSVTTRCRREAIHARVTMDPDVARVTRKRGRRISGSAFIIWTLLAAATLNAAHAQVPGAVYTVSGYDNTDGEDAICWSAPAFHNHTVADEFLQEGEEHDEDHLDTEDFDGINWESELVPSFVAGPTRMLPSCPSGTTVHVDILPEVVYGSQRLRTKRLYTYHVTGVVNLAAIREQYDLADTSFFYSSDGLHDIGLRIEFCPVNGNLCSPFALERDSDTLGGHIHHEGDDHDNYDEGHHDEHVDGDHHDEHVDGDHHDEHGDEDHHDEHGDEDHGDERSVMRRRLLLPKVRATQVVAFNVTFDEPENEEDHEHGEDEDGDHGDEDGDHEDESGHHEDEGEDHEDDQDAAAHDTAHNEQHGHENEDGLESHDNESETDEHDHGHADHGGNSLETEDISHLKHLSSPLFLIPVNISNETEFEFHIDVDVEVVVPGNYLPLASLQFFLSNTTIHGHDVGIDSEAAFKFDVANLLHQRAVFYYDKAYIQTVSLSIEILSYVIICVAGACQLFCLCATFRYREHSVMKLSQGSFLMLLQGAGIVATACSFLYNPKSDAYCILQSPMTLIPLQFMFAIVFGRLRRIISIMEPLMSWNAPQSRRETRSGLKTWRATFMNGRASWSSSSKDGSKGGSKGSRGSKASSQSSNTGEETNEQEASSRRTMLWTPKAFCRSNVRQKYTARRLWLVISLVTLPIIVFEVVGLVLFLPKLVLDMNADESIGRFECGSQEEQTFFLSSAVVLLLTLFLCVFEAQRSRRLPGLFNEAECVSFALLSSLFVGGLGFAVIIVSSEPTADPNAPYIMQVILVSYIAAILVIRLTLPKLRLIWRGEKVVISQMIADHRKSKGESVAESRLESSIRNGVSGLSSSQKFAQDSLDKLESATRTDSMDPGRGETSSPGGPDKSVTFDDQTIKRISETSLASHTEPTSGRPIIVRQGQAPPDRLIFRVLSHSNAMSRVNERILSGLQVGREDWEDVKTSLDELEGLLNNVEYR